MNLEACRRLGVRSMVAVPLSARQNIIGLIEAFSTEPYGFNDSDVRSLNLLAELILSAMRPEEEDRLAEISRRVVPTEVAAEPAVSVEPEIAAASETAGVLSEPEVSEEVFAQRPEVVAEAIPISNVVAISTTLSTERAALSEPVAAPVADYDSLSNSTPGLAVVAAVLVLAAALGAGVWWAVGHSAHTSRVSVHTPAASQPATPVTADSATPAHEPEPAALTDDNLDNAPATPEQAGLLPQVTGIRHWSSANSSTVVIDIQDQVQYEAHRLPKPERIYFDLQDTKLASELANRVIAVDDALLQRVRVAQTMAGVTRVVLETKGPSDYSVSLQPHPYRLVVEVRKLGSKPTERAKIDLFPPSNPASTEQVATKQTPPGKLPLGKSATEPAPSAGHDQPTALSATPSITAEKHTTGMAPKLVVVLDAGHGGWDLGTVGRKGLLEKDLVLDIVERVGHLIESRIGAEVIYTRKDDTYLPARKARRDCQPGPSQAVRIRPRKLQRLSFRSRCGDVLLEHLFLGEGEDGRSRRSGSNFIAEHRLDER